MRFLHLADLHIGKKIGEYPLIEDQKHVLLQAFDLVRKENLDAIIVSGDIFDSSAPSAEAMGMYDWFLSNAHSLGKPLLMISGNHDSVERLSVASSILSFAGIHIATKIKDFLEPVEIGDTRFYLLPFFRISSVNREFGTDVRNYQEALSILLSKIGLDKSKRNVVVAHQAFLPLGGKEVESSGSETSLEVNSNGYVGGTEAIDVSLLSDFDYAALGHIHKAQFISSNARYAGALLKYHIDEANASRTFTIVSMDNEKVSIEERPIHLKRDLFVLKGSLAELLAGEGHESDYVFCKLTEEQLVDSPMSQLKAKYPFCLGMKYMNEGAETAEHADFENVDEIDKNDLFAAFFEQYGGRELNEDERTFVKSLFEKQEENE